MELTADFSNSSLKGYGITRSISDFLFTGNLKMSCTFADMIVGPNRI
jgi:hypothetical protein